MVLLQTFLNYTSTMKCFKSYSLRKESLFCSLYYLSGTHGTPFKITNYLVNNQILEMAF